MLINLQSLLKKYSEDFDIIIEEFSPAIPTFLNFYKRRPVVLQVQGYTGKKYFGKYNSLYSTALYLSEKTRPGFYKNIIFVSDAARSRFCLNSRCNAQIISNGIPEILLSQDAGESDYILYLGRVDIHHKGLDILLDAYREFNKLLPGIRLVIAGDGRDKERFKRLVSKLPEETRKNIEMRGWVEGERKMSLLRDTLLMVTPSRYEPQGIVVLEAMACMKAVVVSNIPELSFVPNNKAGISFKAGDAASLAHSMKNCIKSNERNEMGKRGRDWVKDFTWDRIALKYEKFLQDVLAKHS